MSEDAPNVDALLQHAHAIRPELDASMDRLTEGIARMEKVFTSLKLGVSARVDISNASEAQKDVYVLLWFRKEGSEWKFVIDSGFEFEPAGTDHSTPLMKASKELRLRSVQHFRKLLAALIRAAEDQRIEAIKAGDEVQKLIGEIENARKTTGPSQGFLREVAQAAGLTGPANGGSTQYCAADEGHVFPGLVPAGLVMGSLAGLAAAPGPPMLEPGEGLLAKLPTPEGHGERLGASEGRSGTKRPRGAGGPVVFRRGAGK